MRGRRQWAGNHRPAPCSGAPRTALAATAGRPAAAATAAGWTARHVQVAADAGAVALLGQVEGSACGVHRLLRLRLLCQRAHRVDLVGHITQRIEHGLVVLATARSYCASVLARLARSLPPSKIGRLSAGPIGEGGTALQQVAHIRGDHAGQRGQVEARVELRLRDLDLLVGRFNAPACGHDVGRRPSSSLGSTPGSCSATGFNGCGRWIDRPRSGPCRPARPVRCGRRRCWGPAPAAARPARGPRPGAPADHCRCRRGGAGGSARDFCERLSSSSATSLSCHA